LKRQHGYDYRRSYERRGVWRYVLIEPSAVASAPPSPTVTSRMVSEAARILARAGRARRASSLRHSPEPRPRSLF
jgi:hypothetical protein